MSCPLYNRLAFNGYRVVSYYMLNTGRLRSLRDDLDTAEKVMKFYHQYSKELDGSLKPFPSAKELVDFMVREWQSRDIMIHDNQGNVIWPPS